jgi:hypothetical protein
MIGGRLVNASQNPVATINAIPITSGASVSASLPENRQLSICGHSVEPHRLLTAVLAVVKADEHQYHARDDKEEADPVKLCNMLRERLALFVRVQVQEEE